MNPSYVRVGIPLFKDSMSGDKAIVTANVRYFVAIIILLDDVNIGLILNVIGYKQWRYNSRSKVKEICLFDYLSKKKFYENRCQISSV